MATKGKRPLRLEILSETDKAVVEWLSSCLAPSRGGKLQCDHLYEKIKKAGFHITSQRTGRLLRFAFQDAPIINRNNGSGTRFFYGISFKSHFGPAAIVQSELDRHITCEGICQVVEREVKAVQTCTGANEEIEKWKKLAMKSIREYKEERAAKEHLQNQVAEIKQSTRFCRSKLLPPSFYILDYSELTPVNVTKDDQLQIKYLSGTFGYCQLHVYRGMHVAVKKFHEQKGYTNKHLQSLVLTEANVLYNLGWSIHIPKLIGINISHKPYFLVSSFHGIDYKSTTIQYFLNNQHSFSTFTSEEIVTFWQKVVGSLIEAVDFVHTCGYAHNDIKANNIIVQKDQSVVLIDFGKSVLFTKAVRRSDILDPATHKSVCPWIAPEVAFGHAAPSAQTDVYSVGYLVSRVIQYFTVTRSLLKKVMQGCKSRIVDDRITLAVAKSILASV